MRGKAPYPEGWGQTSGRRAAGTPGNRMGGVGDAAHGIAEKADESGAATAANETETDERGTEQA